MSRHAMSSKFDRQPRHPGSLFRDIEFASNVLWRLNPSLQRFLSGDGQKNVRRVALHDRRPTCNPNAGWCSEVPQRQSQRGARFADQCLAFSWSRNGRLLRHRPERSEQCLNYRRFYQRQPAWPDMKITPQALAQKLRCAIGGFRRSSKRRRKRSQQSQ